MAEMDDRRRAILAEIPRLRRYARALLRDRDAADDLVQDCLERALTRLENWRTGESPRRWLFTIMHHLFVDQLRKVKRTADVIAFSGDAQPDAVEQATQVDAVAWREIMDALQKISSDRREAIVLVAVEGFSYAEAANILGVPAGTLMSRIARGRDDLRALLDDGGRRKMIRVVDR